MKAKRSQNKRERARTDANERKQAITRKCGQMSADERERAQTRSNERDRRDRVVRMNGGKDGEGSGRMRDPSGGGSDDDRSDGG